MTGIYVGNTPVNQIYAGDAEVQQVYQGSTKIWPNNATVVLATSYQQNVVDVANVILGSLGAIEAGDVAVVISHSTEINDSRINHIVTSNTSDGVAWTSLRDSTAGTSSFNVHTTTLVGTETDVYILGGSLYLSCLLFIIRGGIEPVVADVTTNNNVVDPPATSRALVQGDVVLCGMGMDDGSASVSTAGFSPLSHFATTAQGGEETLYVWQTQAGGYAEGLVGVVDPAPSNISMTNWLASATATVIVPRA